MIHFWYQKDVQKNKLKNFLKNVAQLLFFLLYFISLFKWLTKTTTKTWPHSSAVEQPAVNRLVVSSILTVAAMARWWSDLTHTPFTRAFTGLNPVRVTILKFNSQFIWLLWSVSSAGRASALQAEGRGFEPLTLHHSPT